MSERQTLSWNAQFEDTRRKVPPGEKQLHDFQSIFARPPASCRCRFCASAAFAQTREASSSGVLLDRVAATVNEGVVLSSELDEQMLVIAERLRQQKLELPPAERAAPAGARPPGAAGTADAAREPRRHQGVRRAAQQRARATSPSSNKHRSSPICRRRSRSRASTTPATAKACARNSRCRSCASAT